MILQGQSVHPDDRHSMRKLVLPRPDENLGLETVAIHPDWRRRRIAGEWLRAWPVNVFVSEERPRSMYGPETTGRRVNDGAPIQGQSSPDVDAAWAWYRSEGFEQVEQRYLHVYASSGSEATAAFSGRSDLMPVLGFFHARSEYEDALRSEFARVYSCRRLVKVL